jgi:tetratricopeptide (TPR) repeat protein
MLSSDGHRKSFFAQVIALYQSDVAFRGMTDFSIIGVVVLAFISPIQRVVWPWSDQVGTGLAVPVASNSINAPSQVTPQSTAGPVIPIPYQDVFKQPKLSLGFLFDIDDVQFKQSLSSDQDKLRAARSSIARRDSSETIEALRSATVSDPNVMLLRGAAFLLNDTADGNRTAEALWRQSAAGGNKQASALLGRLMISGREGATNNVPEGLRLIEAGIAAGDPQAMRFAGMGYLSGEFGRLDAYKAAELFKRAADLGDGMAAGFYSRLAADGIGIPSPDAKQAESYLRRAAEAGVTMAQVTLGSWLQNQAEKGLLADPKEAIEWLTRSYEKGNYVAALANISYIYFNTTIAPWNNPTLGAQWIRKCSGFQVSGCQTNTGYSYERGLFGAVNLPMAYVHYEIARQMNSDSAGDYSQKLMARLSASQKDEATQALATTLAALKPPPTVIALQLKDDPSPVRAPVFDLSGAAVSSQSGSGSNRNLSAEADTRSNKADALNKQGKYREAIQEATAALVIAPSNFNVILVRAKSYLSLREYDSALADFNVLVRQDPKNAGYLIERGLTLYRKGPDYYDRALADYTLALTTATSDTLKAALYFNRGLIYKNRSQYAQANAEYDEAEKLTPKDSDIYTERGRVKYFQEKYNDAQIDLNKAIELTPQSSEAYFLRGLASANIIYAVKAECERSSQRSRTEIGGPCSLRLDFDGALDDFKAAIARQPNNSEYHFQVGRLLVAARNYDGAIRAYSNAINIVPSANAFINRGLVFETTGQLVQAMSDFDEAIRIDPRFRNAWGARANVLAKLGDKQRATSDYRTALSIDPNYLYAKEGLSRLGVRP